MSHNIPILTSLFFIQWLRWSSLARLFLLSKESYRSPENSTCNPLFAALPFSPWLNSWGGDLCTQWVIKWTHLTWLCDHFIWDRFFFPSQRGFLMCQVYWLTYITQSYVRVNPMGCTGSAQHEKCFYIWEWIIYVLWNRHDLSPFKTQLFMDTGHKNHLVIRGSASCWSVFGRITYLSAILSFQKRQYFR